MKPVLVLTSFEKRVRFNGIAHTVLEPFMSGYVIATTDLPLALVEAVLKKANGELST
jgi:hypothetical protein